MAKSAVKRMVRPILAVVVGRLLRTKMVMGGKTAAIAVTIMLHHLKIVESLYKKNFLSGSMEIPIFSLEPTYRSNFPTRKSLRACVKASSSGELGFRDT